MYIILIYINKYYNINILLILLLDVYRSRNPYLYCLFLCMRSFCVHIFAYFCFCIKPRSWMARMMLITTHSHIIIMCPYVDYNKGHVFFESFLLLFLKY